MIGSRPSLVATLVVGALGCATPASQRARTPPPGPSTVVSAPARLPTANNAPPSDACATPLVATGTLLGVAEVSVEADGLSVAADTAGYYGLDVPGAYQPKKGDSVTLLDTDWVGSGRLEAAHEPHDCYDGPCVPRFPVTVTSGDGSLRHASSPRWLLLGPSPIPEARARILFRPPNVDHPDFLRACPLTSDWATYLAIDLDGDAQADLEWRARICPDGEHAANEYRVRSQGALVPRVRIVQKLATRFGDLCQTAQAVATETPLPLEYEDCAHLRRRSSALTLAERKLARKEPLVWPPRCGKVSGWAGIGIELSAHATAFSADGAKFVVCGTEQDCLTISLADGKVLGRTTPDGIEADGSPVTTVPNVAKLFRSLGAPAPPGAFGYRDDLRVSWQIDEVRGTLDVTLVALESGVEETLAHFPQYVGESGEPIVLAGLSVAPRGNVIAIETFSGQSGSGYQVGLVNLHAAAAKLFSRLSKLDPSHAKQWQSKARTAAARGLGTAASFTE